MYKVEDVISLTEHGDGRSDINLLALGICSKSTSPGIVEQEVERDPYRCFTHLIPRT